MTRESISSLFPALLFAAALVLPDWAASAQGAAANLGAPASVIDLGPSLAISDVNKGTDPADAWFTLEVQNRASAPVTRILAAADQPGAGLAIAPMRTRPMLVETATSNSDIVVERSPGFGERTFRLSIPPNQAGTLALHLRSVSPTPALLAWSEEALIAHNRQVAVLTGVVSGLLLAATAFAAGAALLSGRVFARWATLFLISIAIGELARAGIFDGTSLTEFTGPYALSALALSLALASGIRLVDYVASFSAFSAGAAIWRDGVTVVIVLIGLAAFAGLPYAGVTVRVLAVVVAALAAGYLAHCGRLGIAGARRLAPAATIFALVSAAASFHALGFFGVNLIAADAIGGFSAAGALLTALATAVPIDPAMEKLRDFREAHKGDDVQATVTDEDLEQVREHAALTASHQGVFDLDLETGLVSLSTESAALLGLPAGAVELSRETWARRIHPEDLEIYNEAIESYRHHPGVAFRLEFRMRGQGGRLRWFELRATMTGQATEAERCLGLIADVTARKNTEAAQPAPGPTDPLTGLGTRAALLSLLDGSGELKARALAVFDVDHFKRINDSLGHRGGDSLLVALAQRIERGLTAGQGPGPARLFRIGGDMFAVLASDIGDLTAFGRRILDMMAEPFSIGARELYLTTGVGTAQGAGATDSRDLLYQAECAWEEAKREGGGRICVYSGALVRTELRDPVVLETDLRRALARQEVVVYYQPIIRLKEGVVGGFEALLRWRHPRHGLIHPQEFISHAERSSLILSLGSLALTQAAKELAQWQAAFPSTPPLYVSVNTTWHQIADEGFAAQLGSVIKRADLAKGSLVLEITESAVIAGGQRAEAGLKRLKAMGASLAIDDFGTGTSSLSQLARFPFDTIKIDKSFLTSAREHAGSKVLSSILTLAHELKLAVVAEGLESEADAALLKQMGCDQGQGYLFGAPMPAAQVADYITAVRGR